jgi:putative ABC transport system ATP-binding protein
MLELKNVGKVYRTERLETQALEGINLKVRPGDFLAVMGPSGSGKSTLLHLLGLLDQPTQGMVELDGRQVMDHDDVTLSHLRNEMLGFVFQSFHLVADLSVLDNVEIPLLYRPLSNRVRRDLALRSLGRVGLSSRVHHYPSQLSGGQQQRVAIARAIVGSPRILLADEPTGNLDSQTGEEIIAILEELNRKEGMSVVMVTHDQRFAERTHRIIRLFDGRQIN